MELDDSQEPVADVAAEATETDLPPVAPAGFALPPVDPPPPSNPPPHAPTSGRLRSAAIGLLAGLLVGGGAVAIAMHHGPSNGSQAASSHTSSTVKSPPPVASPGGGLDVRAVLAKAEPAVVSITSNISNGLEQGTAAGTGMILTPDGKVLTNDHVIDGGSNIKVAIPNHGSHSAHVLGADQADDVALVQIEGVSGLPTVTLGKSATLQVGDPVVAVGNALALEGSPTVTSGIVSALNRQIDTDSSSLAHLIQTDAPINSGNSGGPLLDAAAQVIGMNTAVAGDAQNIGFAIPIDQITPLIADLQQGKAPPSPGVAYLGVVLQDGANGPTVSSVASGSPAAKAAMQAGDVITAIDGQPLSSADDLVSAIRNHSPGDKVTLSISRNGASHDISVTLGSRPAQAAP